MSKRLLYWLLGCAIGVIVCLASAMLRGKYNFFWLILAPVLWGNASLALAQWMGKAKPPEPPVPLTLFPRNTH